MGIEKLLEYFKNRKIDIQITLNIGEEPTVHCITENGLVSVKDANLEVALEMMKAKIELEI